MAEDWRAILEPKLREAYASAVCVVTGAGGFVGSHLVDALLDCGAEVHALVRPTSSGGTGSLSSESGHDRLHVHLCDLRDPYSVRGAMRTLKGKKGLYIFHLAAQAHVGESWQRPVETIESNVLATLHLLDACVELGLDVTKFDTAGTSEEYGNVHRDAKEQHEYGEDGRLILRERSPINPKSIYATSKLAADFLTMNYFDAYGLPTVTTRMFNNYGPRQNPRYFTGTIIGQALRRGRVEVGTLDTRRDMCYVTDGVRGHMHVARWGNPGEVYVYGYGENVTMRKWAEMILASGREMGFWKDVPLVVVPQRVRPGKSDVEELLVGYGKLAAQSGWAPNVGWQQGIERTIRWFAANTGAWLGKIDWKM